MNTSTVRTDRDVTVYKWVDENGRTHFSQKPPVGEVAEAMELKTDSNVMKAVKIAEPEAEADDFGGKIISLGKSPDAKRDAEDDDDDEEGIAEGGLENPYSPDGLQKLLENAKNVSKMMDQRNQQQKAIFNGGNGE